MRFSVSSAEIFIPDNIPFNEGIARTTHLAIGAHQDDLEIMAYDGISQCFQQDDKWFSGVIVTNGSGSPRNGLYASYSDKEMMTVRRKEQKKAAVIGEYGCLILLDHPSSVIKDITDESPIEDLLQILYAANPEIIYTHNLTDKHDTHVSVTLKAIEALRRFPKERRPKKLYGCEVWRDLDWMVDEDKVAFDTSSHENLQAALIGVFDSQVSGGKRYDLATMGRRRAHATYFASHATDESTGIIFGMDLSPLIHNTSMDIKEFTLGLIDRFKIEVENRLVQLMNGIE